MTKGNGRLRCLMLGAAACLLMALAMGSMASVAHAGEGDGGKGRDGHEREHEGKRVARGDRQFGLHDFLDRFDGNHSTVGFDGGDSAGIGGKEGSCSRC